MKRMAIYTYALISTTLAYNMYFQRHRNMRSVNSCFKIVMCMGVCVWKLRTSDFRMLQTHIYANKYIENCLQTYTATYTASHIETNKHTHPNKHYIYIYIYIYTYTYYITFSVYIHAGLRVQIGWL